MASSFKDARKGKTEAFHVLFSHLLWSWKVLERDFWDTLMDAIAALYLTKPDLLNLDLEK